MRILVTGGAGFIGSHLVGELCRENEVVIYDNLSSGRKEFANPRARLAVGDILDDKELKRHTGDVEVFFHLAADPDVRRSLSDPLRNFEINVRGTLNALEACRKNDVSTFVFTSSSTVYGNAENMPTPEDAPIMPVSNYGASKAACENYVMSYSHLYGIKGVILRYANIIGPRLTHGVIYDFYHKLRRDPKRLEILGDGKQKKSYLHVKDCVDATILCAREGKKPFDIFNIGSEEQVTVKEIADIVCEIMGLKGVKYEYTGGRVGWKGDVPVMMLSIEKVKKLGWSPKRGIRESIKDTVRWLMSAKP